MNNNMKASMYKSSGIIVFLLSLMFYLLPASNVLAVNTTYTTTSLSLSPTTGCTASNYTFSQKIPNTTGADHTTSNICTITFPAGTDATTCTGGTFNGVAIGTMTKTATSIQFTCPATVGKGKSFTIILYGITNGNNINSSASISCTNSSGGTNSATYAFTTTACVYTAVIGTGTSNSSSVTPYRGVYEDARDQYIITAAELTAAGLTPGCVINSLSFNVSTKASTAAYSGFTISLGHTTASSFSSATWLTPSFTTVYSGNWTTAAGWNLHTFSTTFTWDGSSNIVVQTCFNNSAYSSTDPVYYSVTTGNTVCYAEMDGSTGCSLSGETTSNNRPNMKLGYVPGAACSGTPTGGTTVASATPVCPSVAVDLSVTGSSIGSGLTYQWESSPDGSSWTAITGATTSTYTAYPTTTTYYRRKITCTASGLSAYSTSKQVVVSFTLACYCTSSATSTADMDIGNVTFGSINNTSACGSLTGTQGTATGTASMYSNFYSSVAAPSVMQGSTVPISIYIPTCGTGYSHRVDVYIDFNKNGLLTDAGESFALFAYANPGDHTVTGNITIPITATVGSTLMRVVVVESSTANPCGTYTWGETEDYQINITAATGCSGTPTAGTVTASPASICVPATSALSLSGYTVAGGITFQWQSSPDNSTWTNITGANLTTYTAGPTTSTWYRCRVTCTNSGITSNTAGVQITVNGPSYTALPYSESFESWISRCGTNDIPGTAWSNYPVTGNNSWRRDDQGADATWTSPTSYVYSPVYTVGSHSARFHSGNASNGLQGNLDVYLNCSPLGAKSLMFDMINTSGTDVLTVMVSTDGGATFPTTLGTFGVMSAWTTQTLTLNSNSATTVVRFQATADYGSTDIGLDNVKVILPCSGVPEAGTATISATSVCSGSTVNLSLTGSSVAGGLTYQWKSSPTGAVNTHTNIAGATTMNYTATVTANTWYICVVTCSGSAESDSTVNVAASVVSCYSMNSTNETTCAGKFYDSGGASGDYGNSEAFTKTFTPGIAGRKMRFTFNSFITESGYDSLFIYNGPTTASPLIGSYAGTTNPGMITSSAANGELTFRFKSDGSTVKAGWDADIACYLPQPMAYVSSAVTQTNTTYVTPGSSDQEIIGIQVVTLGGLTPFALTSITLNTTGSTAPATDILNAKLWYTGTSGTFATSVQDLPTVAGPNGSFTITLATPQTLQEGTNYFWLTYSIKSTAVIGDVVDAQCTQIVMNGTGGTRVPSPTTVVGSRPISACNLGTGTYSVSLPYSAASHTTQGQVNDITSTNVSNLCGNSSYYTGEDVVYIFTPATSGSVTVNLTSSGTYTGLVLYKGCPMNGQGGTCVATEQSSTGDKNFCVSVEAGATYYLIVDSYSTYASYNNYGISISAVDPLGVVNDLPCNAVTVLEGDLTPGDNSCASGTGEPAAPACWVNGSINTVWYKLTTGAAQTSIKIKTIVGSLLNTQIALYSGTCGSLTLVACNDDVAACGTSNYYNSELTVTVTPSTTYYLVVDGKNDLKGTFSLVWVDGAAVWPAVPGQDCVSDVPVCSETFTVGNPGYQAVGNTCDFGTNYCLLSGERGSAWYEIKVNADGNLMFTIEPNDAQFDGTGLVTDDGTDYDFAVWKKVGTGAVSCADILSGTSTPLACNYSYIGVTGLYTGGNSPIANSYTGHTYTSGSYDAAFEAPLPVLAGESYWLVISNFSNSLSGFTINFTNSTNGFNFSVPNPLIWTGGASSTNWFDARNWGNCVQIPDQNHDCIIAASSMYQPIIDNVGAECRSITINAGASLQISSFQNLDVYGNYNNQGILNAASMSSVKMKGTAAQTMDGIMVTPYEFYTLRIEKTGGSVTANQHIECEGTFQTFNGTSIMNMNNNNLTVGLNFLNNNGNTTFIPGTGTLFFDGTAAQNYSNTNGTLTLNNVTMIHTGTGVTILNDMNLGTSGVLTLTTGKIITNGFKVVVNNPASAAVTVGNTTSYVQGNLRRYVNSLGSYDFPVGDATKGYQRANFNFTSASSIGYLTARFDPWSVSPVALGLTECGVTYNMPSLDNGYWTVAANANPLTGKYTATLYNLNYTNATGATATTVMSDHSAGGTGPWQLNNGDGSSGTCVASPVTAVVRQDMSGFSKFGTALSNSGPLPVELLSFNGRAIDQGNLLEWVTATEINNDYFLPEKSSDGVNFVEMQQVDGAGNSNQIRNYQLLDEHPYNPVTYYKLKQVDFDGAYTYSDIIAISNSDDKYLSHLLGLYPNPATQSINLEVYSPLEGIMNVEIVDMFGRTIIDQEYSVAAGTGVYNMDISAIASGVYFTKIHFTTTANEAYKRFIKQ